MPGQRRGGLREGVGGEGGAGVEQPAAQEGLFGHVRILFLHSGSLENSRNSLYGEKVNRSHIFLSFPNG
ncbi:hypothetical protein GCM10017562_32020 [Streptomyces roseofulvus]